MSLATFSAVWSGLLGDGSAAVEASEEELRTAFRGIDTDGNGELDVEELVRVLTTTGGDPLTPEQGAEMVRKIDADGNGTVSEEEFLRWLQGGDAATRQAAGSSSGGGSHSQSPPSSLDRLAAFVQSNAVETGKSWMSWLTGAQARNARLRQHQQQQAARWAAQQAAAAPALEAWNVRLAELEAENAQRNTNPLPDGGLAVTRGARVTGTPPQHILVSIIECAPLGCCCGISQ